MWKKVPAPVFGPALALPTVWIAAASGHGKANGHAKQLTTQTHTNKGKHKAFGTLAGFTNKGRHKALGPASFCAPPSDC